MAALTTAQVAVKSTLGDMEKLIVYSVAGASSGDTWDTSTQLKKAYSAAWLPATGTGAPTILTVSTNTVVTIAVVNTLVDSGYITVLGASI